MKRTGKLVLCLALALIAAGANAYAESPSEAMKDSEGQIMGNVQGYAGNGKYDYVGGSRNESSFRSPERLLALPDGRIVVSDTGNHALRVVEDGIVSTLTGLSLLENVHGYPQGGYHDGSSEDAVFHSPAGIAADEQGNLYVADAGNHSIRKIAHDGMVSTIAGNPVLGSMDGRGSAASFYSPQDVAVAKDGTVYVADTLNHLLRKIAPSGEVTTLNAKQTIPVEVAPGSVEARGSYRDGRLDQALFNEPSGIELDAEGNLYVSDSGNQVIRYVNLQTNTVTTVAGVAPEYPPTSLYATSGFVDGPAAEARFRYPKGIALTEEGGLVIADSMNHAIRYLHGGIVSTLAGLPDRTKGYQNGIERVASFHVPTDVSVADGKIYVADAYNNQIRTYTCYFLPIGVSSEAIDVVLEGQRLSFDAQPEVSNQRIMIPVRAVLEAFGYRLNYEEGQVVEIIGGDAVVRYAVGSESYDVEQAGIERTKQLEAAPYIKDNRMYVPIRSFEEFGMDVKWDQSTRTVVLRSVLR